MIAAVAPSPGSPNTGDRGIRYRVLRGAARGGDSYAVPAPGVPNWCATLRLPWDRASLPVSGRRGRRLAGERRPRVISLQLGRGCSVTATLGARAIATSMGFTPLEGLVMGTRCGDIDPGAVLYVMERSRNVRGSR